MAIETYKINKVVLERFAKLHKDGLLAHAYLFVGPRLSGKFETVQEIAKLLNCEQENAKERLSACGRCPSCIKFQAGNHPDFHLLSCEPSETIKIEEVRDLLGQIRLKSFMASVKIFVIKNAELLTPEAANALLKTLEEPASHSLLILTTSAFDNMLDTIKSRCHWVVFMPLPNETIEKYLKTEHALLQTDAHCLSRFSEGCLGRAQELLDSGFLERKNRAIEEFFSSSNSEIFLKDILAEKETTREFLLILLSWMRDLMLIKSAVNDQRIINIDRLGDLKKMKERFDFIQINQIYEQLVNATDLLKENLNVKMTLLIIKEMVSHG